MGGCRAWCTGEFKRENFGLNYPKPRQFVEPVCGGICLLFLVYLVVFSLFLVATNIYRAFAESEYGSKWLIYITNWAFTVTTISCLTDTVLAIVHYVRFKRSPTKDGPLHEEMPVHFKIAWVLRNLSYTSALCVTVLYWIGWAVAHASDLASKAPELYKISFLNLSVHGVNAVYVLLDSAISGSVVRLFHVYQPMILGLAYFIFSVIYWAAGGTNYEGETFIYPVILDFDNNLAVSFVCTLCFVFLLIPVVHVIFWLISKSKYVCWRQYTIIDEAESQKILPGTQYGSCETTAAENICLDKEEED